MAQPLRKIDIKDLPELLRLAEEVMASRKPRLLTRGGQPVAMLTPINTEPAARQKPKRRDRRTGPDDPLWRLIGSVHSGGPDDVAENKYKYLADASHPPDR